MNQMLPTNNGGQRDGQMAQARGRLRSLVREIGPNHGPPNASRILPHSDDAKNQDMYYIRDVYERLPKSKLPRLISERCNGPYVTYVRSLAKGWPQLQYLADFMDVSASPPKLKFLTDDDKKERASRTKVAIMDFYASGEIKPTHCGELEELSTAMDDPVVKSETLKGRLYVVEDLSSGVIETLGAKYDIDPLLFRAQISDYMWSNPKDPWAELPYLELATRDRRFFCLRYFHLRYFRSQESLAKAREQAGDFNVLRRIDNNGPWEGTEDFDTRGSDIGLVRSKMSLWIKKRKEGEAAVGVLLVDPSIEEGFPLWGGSNNFAECPGMEEPIKASDIPPRTSLFEEVVHWTSTLTVGDIQSLEQDPRIFVKKALLVIASEWMTLMKYLTTRLTQLEWELDFTPKTPYRNPNGLDASLRYLNKWRRRMPVYQDGLTDSLKHVLKPTKFMGREALPDFSELIDDFEHLHDQLRKIVARADRIEASISAIISIEESKKAMQWNRMAARLTYLAVIFVPLSWVSSFFSMAPDITQLRTTFWIYFIISVPLTGMALLVLQFSAFIDKVFRLNRHESGTKI